MSVRSAQVSKQQVCPEEFLSLFSASGEMTFTQSVSGLKVTLCTNLCISHQILTGDERGTLHLRSREHGMLKKVRVGKEPTNQVIQLPVATRSWEEPWARVSFRTSREKQSDGPPDFKFLTMCVGLLLLSWNIG